MRETFPGKMKGDTLSADHVNKVSKTARRLESMVSGGFGQGRENVFTGLEPLIQRQFTVVSGSSSLLPPIEEEMADPDFQDARLKVRPRYFDRADKKWKRGRASEYFVDDGAFGTRLEEGDEFTAYWDQQRSRLIAQPNYLPVGIAPIRNDSGEDLEKFGVLGITGPLTIPRKIEEGDSQQETFNQNVAERSYFRFQDQLAFTGICPAEDPGSRDFGIHEGQFGIVLRALKKDKIGWACVSGCTPVRIDIRDPDHKYAEVQPGCCENLISVECGSAQIIWKDEEGYEEYGECYDYDYGSPDYANWRWAIVRLSNRPCVPSHTHEESEILFEESSSSSVMI